MQNYQIIFIAALAVLACVSAPVMAATYAFSMEDNGKSMSVKSGDVITLSLQENPSTGFRWTLEKSGGLQIMRDSYTPSSTGLIGAAGVRTWMFMVTGSGRQTITATYKQSWMPTTGSETRFTLELISGVGTMTTPVTSPKFGTYFKPSLYKTVYY